MTEVPTTGNNPIFRRRELGVLLRGLRIDRNLTADQVAEQLGVSSSKVSRIETGQRGASSEDIRRLCDLYEVDSEQRKHLTELARATRRRATWQPFGLPYSTYIGLEAEAESIRDFGLGIMPGLLQTPDYARAIVRAAVPRWVPEVVRQRVDGRMARQQILYAERPPSFQAVVDESVLHRVVGSPAIMHSQLEHLLVMADLPSVDLRVIPYQAGALPAGNNKFIILGFSLPSLPDVVFIEGLTGDLYIDDSQEVEVYNTTFGTLSELAATPGVTREIISTMIMSYAAQTHLLPRGDSTVRRTESSRPMASDGAAQTGQTAWRKASFCASGECVEVAQLDDSIMMRDSTQPQGHIRYSGEEWRTFVFGIKTGSYRQLSNT